MKFYIADAFTNEVFGGNPAGVVIFEEGQDYPDDETMRKTAAELRYSETAFIKPLHKLAGSDEVGNVYYDRFQVRYFTPAAEVDLCGHATIASFHCLREAGLAKAGTTVLNKTLAGDLNIVVGEDSILMDMAVPEFIGDIKEPEAMKELYEIMGLDYEKNIPELERQCAANGGDGSGLKPEIISTGLPDILMPVASREELAAIKPDFVALTELSRKYEVVGVHAFTLDGGKHRGGSAVNHGANDGAGNHSANGKDGNHSANGSAEVTAYCRNFAPLYDIDEEAATGTSNGALTYYLIRNEVGEDPDRLFIQGEAMGRPSAIKSLSENNMIKVGGSAVILAEGEIHI